MTRPTRGPAPSCTASPDEPPRVRVKGPLIFSVVTVTAALRGRVRGVYARETPARRLLPLPSGHCGRIARENLRSSTHSGYLPTDLTGDFARVDHAMSPMGP